MTEDDATKLKAEIDAAVADADPDNAVRFGEVAYFVFLQKRWIVWRKGIGRLPPNIQFNETAYAGRKAILDPRLPHGGGSVDK